MAMEIMTVENVAFAAYGRVLAGYPVAGALEAIREVPMEDGLRYQPRAEVLHLAPDAEKCGDMFFGGLPYQLGYLVGTKTKLDELHFHRSCALYAGAEAFVLLAAAPGDLADGKLDVGRIRAFLVPAGVAVEVYGGVVHALRRAPKQAGIRALVLLPYATKSNYRTTDQANFVDKMLWGRNTWVLAHRFSPEAVDGAVVALEGDNLDIKE